MAKKYIWWQPPDSAIKNPYRIPAGAMNLGSIEDYHAIVHTFGKEVLADTIKLAAPGWFSRKSWTFWHHILDLIKISEYAPPLPHRTFS